MRYIIQVQLKRECFHDFQIQGGPESNSLWADKVQRVVHRVKHSAHVISGHQCDDDDVQCCKVYTQATMLARKKKKRIHMCTINGNVLCLFKADRTPLYTAHVWCSYSPAKLRKLQVVHNDAFRDLMKLPRWSRANHMFVSRNTPPPPCSAWKILCLNSAVDWKWLKKIWLLWI